MAELNPSINKLFDDLFYIKEYEDLAKINIPLVEHFATVGWIEGRNPSSIFDTNHYLETYPDIRTANTNPLVHYLDYGQKEGRNITPAVSINSRLENLFGIRNYNWQEHLTKILDPDFYVAQLLRASYQPQPKFNLCAHFWFRGWREGFDPNPNIDIAMMKDEYPHLARLLINPMIMTDKSLSKQLLDKLSYLETGVEIEETSGDISQDRPETASYLVSEKKIFDHEIEVIKPFFDEFYYSSQLKNQKISITNLIEHFFSLGTYEGLKPNREFDPEYYLAANPDVKEANINPFWHYIVTGKKEGRLPRVNSASTRSIINRAYQKVELPEVLNKIINKNPEKALNLKLNQKKPLIISLSHDQYTKHVGGIQIYISDEQSQYNELLYEYLHIAPTHNKLKILNKSSAYDINLTLNGKDLPATRSEILFKKLQDAHLTHDIQIIIHSLLGHDLKFVRKLCQLFCGKPPILWLHDFSLLCEGFNLLRNDYVYCGAPKETSNSCLVCAYGKDRSQHLSGLKSFITAFKPMITVPSKSTARIFASTFPYPLDKITVLPHWQIEQIKPRVTIKTSRSPASNVNETVKIGFVGYDAHHKGWNSFANIVQNNRNKKISFFHFAKSGTPSLAGVKFVDTETTPANRTATISALKKAKLDILLVLSIWPETFSFVTYEGILAGCTIFALKDSGNVADTIEELKIGRVFNTDKEIIDFINSRDLKKHTFKNRNSRRVFKKKVVNFSANIHI